MNEGKPKDRCSGQTKGQAEAAEALFQLGKLVRWNPKYLTSQASILESANCLFEPPVNGEQWMELGRIGWVPLMTLLHVALQDGFDNDTVVVWCNSEEIYRKDDVSTRLQISRADAFEVDVPAGNVTVKVDVPSRDLSRAIPVDLSKSTYIGVSVTPEGELMHKLQGEPFGYV